MYEKWMKMYKNINNESFELEGLKIEIEFDNEKLIEIRSTKKKVLKKMFFISTEIFSHFWGGGWGLKLAL